MDKCQEFIKIKEEVMLLPLLYNSLKV